MPLMPFKKTREFTFSGYDGSSWVGASEEDYRDLTDVSSTVSINIKYNYANGATAITHFELETINGITNNGCVTMPEKWLTFNTP